MGQGVMWTYGIFIDPPVDSLPVVCIYRCSDEREARREFGRLIRLSPHYVMARFPDHDPHRELPSPFMHDRWRHEEKRWSRAD
jgi:hypothetical protein